MKLKKAIREYARAVDNLACITEHKRHTDDLLWFDSAIEADLEMARKEKRRTVRQMNAAFRAMQYRGENKMWYAPQKRAVTRLQSTNDVMSAWGRAAVMGCDNKTKARYVDKIYSFMNNA